MVSQIITFMVKILLHLWFTFITLVLHLWMIITFMGDTDCVFSDHEILWSSCFDCSITLKFR